MSICILYVYKYVSGIYILYNATHTLENFSCSGYTVHKFSQNYSAKCRQKTRQKISYPWNFAKLSNLFLKSKLNYTVHKYCLAFVSELFTVWVWAWLLSNDILGYFWKLQVSSKPLFCQTACFSGNFRSTLALLFGNTD